MLDCTAPEEDAEICSFVNTASSAIECTVETMTLTLSRPHHVATLVDLEPRTSGVALCPMCETTRPSENEDLRETGCDWLCVRCGQRWDATRLQTAVIF